MTARRRVCGLCGRAFALVVPPDDEETERDKLCPECDVTFPAAGPRAGLRVTPAGRRLRAALGFLQLPPTEPELRLLHRWLDSWAGLGLRGDEQGDAMTDDDKSVGV